MIYKVKNRFRDQLDSLFTYDEGVTYPRVGYKPPQSRIKALESKDFIFKSENMKEEEPVNEEI